MQVVKWYQLIRVRSFSSMRKYYLLYRKLYKPLPIYKYLENILATILTNNSKCFILQIETRYYEYNDA